MDEKSGLRVGDLVTVDNGCLDFVYEKWPGIQDCWLLEVVGQAGEGRWNLRALLPASAHGRAYVACPHVVRFDRNELVGCRTIIDGLGILAPAGDV